MIKNTNLEQFELNEDDTKKVVGGASNSVRQYMTIVCPKCGRTNNVDVMKDSFTCHWCGLINKISG